MTQRRNGFSVRENARHGTNRDPVASTVSTGDATAPLETSRQRRALRGPKNYRTAVVSTVRDAWATPVVVVKEGRGKRKRTYRDPIKGATRNLGGSTPCDYVYGTG